MLHYLADFQARKRTLTLCAVPIPQTWFGIVGKIVGFPDFPLPHIKLRRCLHAYTHPTHTRSSQTKADAPLPFLQKDRARARFGLRSRHLDHYFSFPAPARGKCSYIYHAGSDCALSCTGKEINQVTSNKEAPLSYSSRALQEQRGCASNLRSVIGSLQCSARGDDDGGSLTPPSVAGGGERGSGCSHAV